MFKRQMQRHPGAGDGSAARAAIGGQHIAIKRDGHFPHRLQIRHRAQAATDQALDFLRAARLLAARGFPVTPRMGGARQHAIFRRDPTLALAAQEGGHLAFHACGAQHLGQAHANDAGTFRMARHAWLDGNGAKRAGGAA